MGPRWTKADPVVFENRAGLPVDLFWWNGTCEELVSWPRIGGIQNMQQQGVQASQGHTFRIRNSFTQQLLMQHTLSDVVIRGCDDGSKLGARFELDMLRMQTAALAAERRELHDKLTFELASLVAALKNSAGNRSSLAGHQSGTDSPLGVIGVSPLGSLVGAAGLFGK